VKLSLIIRVMIIRWRETEFNYPCHDYQVTWNWV